MKFVQLTDKYGATFFVNFHAIQMILPIREGGSRLVFAGAGNHESCRESPEWIMAATHDIVPIEAAP